MLPKTGQIGIVLPFQLFRILRLQIVVNLIDILRSPPRSKFLLSVLYILVHSLSPQASHRRRFKARDIRGRDKISTWPPPTLVRSSQSIQPKRTRRNTRASFATRLTAAATITRLRFPSLLTLSFPTCAPKRRIGSRTKRKLFCSCGKSRRTTKSSWIGNRRRI